MDGHTLQSNTAFFVSNGNKYRTRDRINFHLKNESMQKSQFRQTVKPLYFEGWGNLMHSLNYTFELIMKLC